jgi:hypothetical protein
MDHGDHSGCLDCFAGLAVAEAWYLNLNETGLPVGRPFGRQQRDKQVGTRLAG